jgi:hypothetical protein
MKFTALFGTVGFAALLMTSTVVTITPAQAQRWEDCRDRIDHAERHLDRMIERFGRHSDAARGARRDLENTRDWCYRNHRSDWDRHDDRDRHDGWRH